MLGANVGPAVGPAAGRAAQGDLDSSTVAVPRVDLTASDEAAVRTTPNLRQPTSRAAMGPAAIAARPAREIVRALAPLVWSLDDCARFLDDISEREGDQARQHAAVARQVARLIAALQVSADELE